MVCDKVVCVCVLVCVKLLYVKFVCVCEVMVCDMCGGGGGRREDPGYRIKNKNPTQSCGEKHNYRERGDCKKTYNASDLFSPSAAVFS